MSLGEASARITLDISDLAGKSAQAQGILTGLDGAAGKATGGMSALTKGFLAFGAAAIPAMITGVREAVNLEQAIANVNAALGGVDAGTLEGLADTFRQIGVDSQFSATEVAQVGEELAKAGFTTEEIMNGATQSVVNLAQATGDGLNPALTAVIATMNTWNETAAKSGQAVTDASRVADVFTIAANESSAGIADINAGMRNLGPVAVSLGIPFEHAAAAIALFTNNGLKGADAGISLARGFQNLADPTSEAAQWMDTLGIAAFDMNGNFVGMPELFRQLQTGMADLDDQTKLTALSTIFGAEAMDVMGLAILNGADPLQALIDLMGESGAAAEQSALRMDTLGAQWDTLKEGISTLLASLVSGLIPGMRLVVDFANTLVDAFMKIPGPIKTVIGAITALAAAFATLTGAGAGLRMLGITGAFGGISAAPFLALAAGIGIAYAAIKFNLFGIGDAIAKFTSVWNGLADSAANNSISRFLIALGQALQTFDVALLDQVGRGLDAVGKSVNAFFDGFRGPGGKAVEKTAKQFEGFAELADDGVTWKIKNEGGEDIGEIIKSWDNADGTTTVRIKTKGGEEFETTIDMVTGFVEGEYDAEVEIDTKDSRKQIDKLQDGLDGMTASLEKSRFPWLAAFPRAASKALDSVRTLTEGFRMAREAGADPLEASLRAIGMTIPGLSSATARLEMGWRDLKDTFQDFRERGMNPVEAGILTLGAVFPALRTAMNGVYWAMDGLGDAFSAAIRGDWAGAFEGLAQAARSAWVVMQELGSAVGTVAVNIGNWVMGQIPNVWSWLQDTAIPSLGAGAVWLWSALVNIGSWAKGIVSDLWPYVTQWATDAMGAVASAAGTLWGVIINIGSWIVGEAPNVWDAIAQWVLGTGGGMSGAGRSAGGGLASAAGTGIPIGAVAIQIREWKIVASAADVWSAITSWVDDQITVTDAEAAAFEPKGREIGQSIMRAIIDGIKGAFDSGDAGGGRSSGGAGGGPIGAGGSFGGGLGRFIMPILDGMWDELQPELDAWKQRTKHQIESWWNAAVPEFLSVLKFDQTYLPSTGGLTAGGGLRDALGIRDGLLGSIQDELDGIMTDLNETSASFQQQIQGWADNLAGMVSGISLPSVSIDWGGFGDSIAEGWQGAMDLLQNVLDWLKNPWENVGSIDIKLPSISIDLGPIDTIIDQIKDKTQALKDAWNDLRFWESGGDGQGGGAAGSTGGSTGKKVGPLSGAAGSGFDQDSFAAQGRSAALAFANAFTAGLGSVTPVIGAKAAEWSAALQTGTATLGTQVGASMLGVQMAMSTSLTAIGASIGTQAAMWGVNLATGLQSLTTASTTAFLGMQMGITMSMATIGSTITTQSSAWGAALASGMAVMASTATSAMATIGAVVQAGMTIATAAVTAGGAAMASAMASAGAAMSSAAASAAATTASVLQAGMAIATAAIASAASQWPGIIAAAGGAMYAAGYSTGAMAGQGVVAGLLSMLGAVQAAASAIVSTALGAMSAAAAIRSPSKITTGYGQMMGQGLIVGMRQMQPAIARQSASMMAMAQPTPYMPAVGAMGGSVTNSSTVIHVDTHVAGHVIGVDDLAAEVTPPIMQAIQQGVHQRGIAKGMAR